MIRRIKTYYNKDSVDYSSGLVDPLKYHTTFNFFINAFQVGVKKPSGIKVFFNQNTLLLLTGSTACLLTFISLIHGIDTMDIFFITESGTYVIVLIYKVIILSTARLNYTQYQSFLRAMKNDFEYICKDSSIQKYRKRFFDNQLLTWKICIFSVIFTMAIAVGMVSFAIIMLIMYLVTHVPGDGQKRPLVFPFWIQGVDFGATPIYEIAFMFSNFCVVGYSYNYIFMIQTEIVWVRHITTKVDMVIWLIEDLLEDIYPTTNREENEHFTRVIKQRMRHIIMHHQSMYSLLDDWVAVYKKLLMFEQKFCASVACLTAYCTAEKLDQGELQLISILLFVGTVVLHFIPCYLCTYLANKINSVCDACWNIPFWKAGKVIRPYLVILMQRSMRRLPLQAPGFEEISVETYSSKMGNAYSAFNMLRQINK